MSSRFPGAPRGSYVNEPCATCAHRQHASGECAARYHVTFKEGEPGDPCLCTHQAHWDTYARGDNPIDGSETVKP